LVPLSVKPHYQFHPELYIQESSINGINQLPKRDGGSLEFITGDFMSPEIFDNKRFDVIMSFKTLQYYSGDLLEKAALDLENIRHIYCFAQISFGYIARKMIIEAANLALPKN